MVVGLSRQHKIAIISIFFISNNIEEKVNMIEMEDVKKKDPNCTSRDKKDNKVKSRWIGLITE